MKPESEKKSTAPSPPGKNAAQNQAHRPFKALHHLPRGKNAWNPPFMKEWWFWPACIAGLVLLKILASLVYRLLEG